ncbi:MAG: ribose-5-phosphate isomerase RpiA [Planctomycetota bacterium]
MANTLTAGRGDSPAVCAAAQHAVALVRPGEKVGLGSGRASTAFIRALGEQVRQGLCIEGVATSNASERLARELHIPLVELEENTALDSVVDGADEVAPNLDLIKGWGGALVRERIVTCAARRQIILVSPEKLVQGLGERGRIPVEIIPFARGYVSRRLKELGLFPSLRLNADGTPFISENQNLTLDCALEKPLCDGAEARALEARIVQISGVVDTGMFLGTADQVIVGQNNGSVEVLARGRG